MTNFRNGGIHYTEYLDAQTVERLSSRLRAARRNLEKCLYPSGKSHPMLWDGWQIAPYDPNRLLASCKSIRLRPGFKLASYQFVAGGNGNGLTLVIPEDRSLPISPGRIYMGWDGPSPVFKVSAMDTLDWIHQDVGEFLEGDESLLSYFEASLFLRELRELGAVWHGTSWDTHEILAAPKEWDPAVWKWEEYEPKDWRPSVTRASQRMIRVVFFSYSQLGRQHIVRHVDTYSSGYRFTTQEAIIGSGGPGFVF